MKGKTVFFRMSFKQAEGISNSTNDSQAFTFEGKEYFRKIAFSCKSSSGIYSKFEVALVTQVTYCCVRYALTFLKNYWPNIN